MNEKELYRQKQLAQLNEWKADIGKLKARAAREKAEAQLTLNNHINSLEIRIEEEQAKLAKLENASDDAWESIKEGVESRWASLKSAVSEAASKFKN